MDTNYLANQGKKKVVMHSIESQRVDKINILSLTNLLIMTSVLKLMITEYLNWKLNALEVLLRCHLMCSSYINLVLYLADEFLAMCTQTLEETVAFQVLF